MLLSLIWWLEQPSKSIYHTIAVSGKSILIITNRDSIRQMLETWEPVNGLYCIKISHNLTRYSTTIITDEYHILSNHFHF